MKTGLQLLFILIVSGCEINPQDDFVLKEDELVIWNNEQSHECQIGAPGDCTYLKCKEAGYTTNSTLPDGSNRCL